MNNIHDKDRDELLDLLEAQRLKAKEKNRRMYLKTQQKKKKEKYQKAKAEGKPKPRKDCECGKTVNANGYKKHLSSEQHKHFIREKERKNVMKPKTTDLPEKTMKELVSAIKDIVLQKVEPDAIDDANLTETEETVKDVNETITEIKDEKIPDMFDHKWKVSDLDKQGALMMTCNKCGFSSDDKQTYNWHFVSNLHKFSTYRF